MTAELSVGAALLRAAARRAPESDARRLLAAAAIVDSEDAAVEGRVEAALAAELLALLDGAPPEPLAVYDRGQRILVDRPRARFGAWYELFPRSTSPTPGAHGTFETTIAWLPYVAEMGFDVLYLPPIHPIGRTNRKGKNNAPVCALGDPGSPWAVGSE